MRIASWLCATLALGFLAGCGSEKSTPTKGTSFGEVLPGSASDAMLPYDTATSAPPLEAPVFGSDTGTRAPRGSASDSSTSDQDVVPEVQAT